MKENLYKAVVSTAAAGFAVYFRSLLIPIVILLLVMILDYFTGMAKAYITDDINSRKGIIGILKKVGYLAVVCVGMGVDWIITTALSQVGITFTATFAFALLVIMWLIINELISILENVSKMGIPMPEFLIKIVSKLKVTVESKGEKVEVTDNE